MNELAKLHHPSDKKYLNSAFLVRSKPVKEKIQRYDKIRLLPFGEYLPHKGTIPWSHINVPDVGHYLPGKEYTVFRGSRNLGDREIKVREYLYVLEKG